jgi:hypothetical protein
MNADDLRSLQTPLKAQYQEHPETAFVTLRARGRLGERITCKIETGKSARRSGSSSCDRRRRAQCVLGRHVARSSGGMRGRHTLRAVATALGIPMRSATIRAEGDLDFRGTLGVSKDVPVGFREIRLHFDLDTDASEEQLATLLRLTERYCVVYQTLNHPAKIDVSYHATSR